jgi:hypothetical protein
LKIWNALIKLVEFFIVLLFKCEQIYT